MVYSIGARNSSFRSSETEHNAQASCPSRRGGLEFQGLDNSLHKIILERGQSGIQLALLCERAQDILRGADISSSCATMYSIQ